jgi:hypothetical protein
MQTFHRFPSDHPSWSFRQTRSTARLPRFHQIHLNMPLR